MTGLCHCLERARIVLARRMLSANLSHLPPAGASLPSMCVQRKEDDMLNEPIIPHAVFSDCTADADRVLMTPAATVVPKRTS